MLDLPILLIILNLLLISTSASDARFANPSPYCVQIIQKSGIFSDHAPNLKTTIVDVKTERVIVERRPVIPSNAWFSPDGKNAAFWQVISETEVGLYIGSTTIQSTKLLYKTTPEEVQRLDYLRPPPGMWSPDSGKFVYVVKDSNGKFTISVVNTDGTGKLSQTIVSPQVSYTLNDVYLYGWSADSVYVATASVLEDANNNYVADANIWSVSNLQHPQVVRMGMGQSYDENYGPLAWAPTGHRLTMLLDAQTNQQSRPMLASVIIYSPEKGIEAQSTHENLDNDYYHIFWSPDERHIRLEGYWGHGSSDTIFGVVGKTIVKAANSRLTREFVSWLEEGQVLVYDASIVDPSIESDLTLIDIPANQVEVLVSKATGHYLSDDKKFVVYTSWINGIYSYFALNLLTRQTHLIYSETHGNSDKPTDYPNYISYDGKFMWLYYGPPDIRGYMIRVSDGKRLDVTNGIWTHDSDSIIHKVTQKDKSYLERLYFDKNQVEILITLSEKERAIDIAEMSPDKSLWVVLTESHDLLYLLNLDSREKYPIRVNGKVATMSMYIGSTQGGYTHIEYGLAWSSDNSMLAFIDFQPSNAELVVVSGKGE